MTTDTTLSAAEAMFEAEQAVSRARWVVEELQETITCALRVLDDAELDSAKAKLSERGSFYLEAAGEHLGRLRTRCNDILEFTHDLFVHLNRASQSVTDARTLLDLAEPPTAVVYANDLMAIGALDVAHERGLDVPGDVALIGFDDVDAATIVTPQLTTVRNPAYEAGSTAGDLLLSRMSGRYGGTGRTVVLPCPLFVRGTA